MSDLSNLAELLFAIPLIMTLTMTNLEGYREAREDLRIMDPESHKQSVKQDGLICRAVSYIGRKVAYSLY